MERQKGGERMRLIALVCALFLTACALPPEQRAYEAAYQTLHVADTLQTLDIKRHPWAHETNPVLGKHPKDAEIIAYMAAEAALHYLITDQLAKHDAPIWLQRFWHGASITLAASTVTENHIIGLRVRF